MVADGRPVTRDRYSFTNMALSLGIVVVIAVVIVVLFPRPHYNAVKPIDPTEAFTSATRVAPYHVFVPHGLSADWQPTSATVTGPDAHHVVHLHVGYYSPKGNYVALEESNASSVPFIELETSHGKFVGQQIIGANAWEQRYAANQKDRSIDWVSPQGATVIVTGSAPYDELAVLAASLR